MHRERTRARFTADEVGDLIRLASRLDTLADEDTLDLDQLAAVAAELGVSRSSLMAALRERRRLDRSERRAAAKAVRRRMRFIRHATTYTIVMLALLAVDAAAGGGWWFFYPAALWGIFLVLHATRFLTGRRGPVERLVSSRVAAGWSVVEPRPGP